MRSKARLDLLDTVSSPLLLSGLLLSLAVSESCFWLALSGFALLTAVYALKGVHLVRARRRPTASSGRHALTTGRGMLHRN